ncbi:MAG: class I SAM-dependent methyltransferase [Ignavibacteriaceae bacterium]|jgi:O-methyltransferase|nr:class I SAM-dependent methyltransferase [Ignavibacteriaceae bacterium]
MNSLLLKLYFIRKIKGLFMRFRLDFIFGPFSGIVMFISYLAKLSKWRAANKNLPFNDFYNGSVKYQERFKLHDFVFTNQKLNRPIAYLEFGVADGISLEWWVKQNNDPKSVYYGFDTFTGLPEDFGVIKKADYDRSGVFPPIEDDRITYVAGLFQSTLPSFLQTFSFKDKQIVLHMDADLYSSTLYVLTMLALHLKPGDIIIFDEFGVPLHEFRAFTDFTEAYPIKFKPLGAVNNYLQVAFVIE